MGDVAIIAAGAVVTRDVAAFPFGGGSPARPIWKRFTPEVETVDAASEWCVRPLRRFATRCGLSDRAWQDDRTVTNPSLRRKAATGSLLLMLGEAVVYGSSFIRNMILARALGKADFGIAATFSLVIMLLEFSAKLGVAQCVVRDKRGDEPDFIAAAHLVQFFTATLSAVVIAVCAAPLSNVFGIPQQQLAIMLLALIPFFRGLEHVDIRRFERDLRFAPSLLVEACPQVVITLAAWPVASWLGDYRAVLVLLLVKGLASCVGSHLVAERPYRWHVEWVDIARMLHFGWPLLFNGFLMFGVLQGDQFLVAAAYTMTDLAPYAAAAALTMAPTFFFGRVFNSVMLPVLAKVQDDPATFAKRYRQVLAVITLFAVVLGMGMILGGEALMRLVYGAKYSGAGVLLALLSGANAFRTLRIAPTLAAFAKGDSRNQMISNAGRVISLLPAVALAITHQPLWTIACTGIVGEALACSISFQRLWRRDAIPLSVSLVAAGWILLAITASQIFVWGGFHHLPVLVGLLVAAVTACAAAVTMMAVLPELRLEAARYYTCWRGGDGWRGFMQHLRGGGTLSNIRSVLANGSHCLQRKSKMVSRHGSCFLWRMQEQAQGPSPPMLRGSPSHHCPLF